MLINCPNCDKKTVFMNDTCEHCGIKIKRCSECGNVVEENKLVCDYCGCPFETPKHQDKQEDQMPSNLEKTATKLAAFAEKENKKYNLIGKVIGVIGEIIAWLSFLPILITANTGPTLYSLLESKAVFSVILAIGFILIFTKNVFKELRCIFSFGAIERQMRALKFDYKRYISLIRARKDKGTYSSDYDFYGEMRLIQVARYQENPSTKTNKLLRQLSLLACYLLIGIFAFIGLNELVGRFLYVILFGIEHLSISVFINVWLILTFILWIIGMTLNSFFNKDDEETQDWLEKNNREE